MAIWFKDYSHDDIRELFRVNMLLHLGMEFVDITNDALTARMPVDHRTQQPFGLLHGGASVALAESLASTAANLVVDPKKQVCVGLEINANHLRSVKSGFVTGTTRPIHLGKTTQVWNVEIVDEKQKPVCTSRMTAAVLDIPPNSKPH